ncbi:MAG: hypothetical protein Q8M29_14435 [Bacteroidota bacterium]|nr:hypothetical protein [Bacteroidota bacterium]
MRKYKNKIGVIACLCCLLMVKLTSVAQNYVKTDRASFVGFNTSLQSKNLYVRDFPASNSCVTATPVRILKKATITALLDWKGDNIDASVAQYKVDLTINGYTSYTGSGITPYNYMRTLTIDKNSPQSYVTIDVTSIQPLVNKFIVTATYTRISGASEPTVETVMQTDVYLTEEFVYTVPQSVGGNISIAPAPVTFSGTEAKFTWNVSCVPAPNYQFQLLRLYNTSTSTMLSETNITTSVDWDKALTIETGNDLNQLKLTITEGTGYYVWRVRQIGNAYPGGIANDRNWGDWTDVAQFVQGAINEPVSSTSSSTPYLFYYNQFDADKNWIFTRSFIEGDAVTNGQINIGEAINYANGLQMSIQSQSRLKSANRVLVGQTIYDYSGRPALSTLPAPHQNSSLAYIPSFSKNSSGNTYSAVDFDENSNYLNPLGMSSSSGSSKYYSSNNNLETNVPSAFDYPYSRTLFMRDGTSKPKEESTPGLNHKLGNTGDNIHTTRSYITGVTDAELIRVFGDEAPNAISAIKTITIDVNNEKSISYISKEGKTIATCLASPKSANLDPLPAPVPLLIEYNVTNNTPYGSSGLRSFQSIVVTETPTTPVTIDYSITPNIYTESCIPFCATCDYKVTIKVIDNNEPDAAPLLLETVVVPSFSSMSGTCPSNTYTNLTHTVALPPGSYTIERIIEGNQYHPSPSVANTNPTYLEQYLKDIENALKTKYNTGLATAAVCNIGGTTITTTTVTMAGVNAYLNPVGNADPDIEQLYAYLGLSAANAAAADHITLTFGCNDVVTLPIVKCDQTECPVLVPNTPNTSQMVYDFEKMYTDWYATTHSGAVTTINTLFPEYTQGEFNIVVTNMIDCQYAGYDCKKLVENFVATYLMSGSAMVNALPNNGPGNPNINNLNVNGMQGPGNFPTSNIINYFDMFMENAFYSHGAVTGTGYQIEEIHNATGGLGCLPGDQGYKFHPYRYIKYTSTEQCNMCERIFYSEINANNPTAPSLPTSPPDSPYPSVTGTTFINAFNAAAQTVSLSNPLYPSTDPTILQYIITYPKSNFYNCLKNTNISDCNPTTNPVVTSPAVFASATQTQCEQACQDRYPLFVNSIIDEYHGNGIQVEGDVYVLVLYQNTYVFDTTHFYGPVDTSLATIYCQAQGLVDACKTQCTLTVTTDANGQVSVGTVAEQQAMANAMYGVFDLQLPYESFCPHGYANTGETILTVQASYYVNILNQELATIRSNAPLNGINWEYQDFLDQLNPALETDIPCNTKMMVFVHPDIPSYFDFDVSTNRIVYFFNKKQPGTSLNPKYIFSQAVVPQGVNNEGFLYLSVGTPTASAAFVTAGNASAYFIDQLFAPYTPVATSMDKLITAYIANVMTPATVLTGYFGTPEPFEQPYWRYEICPVIARGEVSCGGICYRINPPKPVDPNDPEISDELITYTNISCAKETANQLNNLINKNILGFITAQLNDVKAKYKLQCVDLMQDMFKVSYTVNYHHYTLYYYDRAGNMVKTVPPKGVVFVSDRQTNPAHTFVTEYEYNSLGQLIRQLSPDGGESKFWYDNKSRLRFSQNAKQLVNGIPAGSNPQMSYTKYDDLGRIIEVGEMPMTGVPSYADLNNFNYPASGVGKDITVTVYSIPASGVNYFGNKPQTYLQNNVSYTLTDKDGNIVTTNDQVVSYYSYDPHGNVEWLIQDIPEIGRSYLAYEYDLISGNIIKIKYNEAFPDKFFHRYTYDVDRKIKTAETSKDEIFWEKDASYEYYLHGPLKRTVIGQDKVQGQDYVYTLQGWLKGLNHTTAAYDPGHDGSNDVGTDAYSMLLGYYSGDYVNGTSAFNSDVASNNPYALKNTMTGTDVSDRDLFNGNISSWTSHYDYSALNRASGGAVFQNMDVTTGRVFNYDELNRLTSAYFYTQDNGTLTWNGTTNYQENFSYDANGNFSTLYRNGYSNISGKFGGVERRMDNFTYNYWDPTHNNKLKYVQDLNDNMDPLRYNDIKDQSSNILNYQYDEIGNLISDDKEGINKITWNVYGKISKIEKTNGTTLEFLYDATGKRVYKKVYNPTVTDPITDASSNTTYYTLDASGNQMAVYERKNTGTSPNYTATYTLKEQGIYGSDRLGLRNESTPIVVATASFTPTTPPVVNQSIPVQVSSTFNNMTGQVSYTGMGTVYQQDFNSGSSSILGWGQIFTTPNTTISWINPGKVRLQTTSWLGHMNYKLPVQQGIQYTLQFNAAYSAISPVLCLYINNVPTPYILALQALTQGNNTITFTAPAGDVRMTLVEGGGTSGTTIDIDDIVLTAPNAVNGKLAHINTITGTAINYPTPPAPGYSAISTALYEDDCGDVVLSGMVMQPFNNSGFRTMIYGQGGNLSNMFNTVGMKNSIFGKNMFMKKPGSTNEYFYFTVGTDKKAYYHVINASTGYISKNNLLDNVSGYHYSMALLEDRVGPANSQLYMKRWAGSGTVQLIRFEISSTGNIGAPIVMDTYASGESWGDSEIQVKPDGNELLVGNNKGTPTGYGVYSGGGELRIYSLNTNHAATYTGSSYNYGPGTVAQSFDYTNTGAYIFYKNTTYQTPTNLVKRITRSTLSLSGAYNISTNGDVRRGMNNSIYVANNSGSTNQLIELKNVNNASWTGSGSNVTVYSIPGTGTPKINTGLSLNRHLIHNASICNPAVATRITGNKEYELKDHLSNVHVVVSDKKIALDDASTDVIFQEHFAVNTSVQAWSILGSYPTTSISWLAAGKLRLSTPVKYGNAASIMALQQGSNYTIQFASSYTTATAPKFVVWALDNSVATVIGEQSMAQGNNGLTFMAPAGTIYLEIYEAGTPSGTSLIDIDDLVIIELGHSPYISDIRSATDYYAFGMPMPGRQFTSANGKYRFGYNDQEKDDEVYGPGNLNAAEHWEYDTRLGRRWNIDPVVDPGVASYACFNNNPVHYSDINGDSPKDKKGKPDSNVEHKQYGTVKVNPPTTCPTCGGGNGTTLNPAAPTPGAGSTSIPQNNTETYPLYNNDLPLQNVHNSNDLRAAANNNTTNMDHSISYAEPGPLEGINFPVPEGSFGVGPFSVNTNGDVEGTIPMGKNWGKNFAGSPAGVDYKGNRVGADATTEQSTYFVINKGQLIKVDNVFIYKKTSAIVLQSMHIQKIQTRTNLDTGEVTKETLYDGTIFNIGVSVPKGEISGGVSIPVLEKQTR